MDKKIASFILRFRTPLLVIITVLTVFFGWRALHLKLSYDFEKLLPRNHSYVKTYQEFQQVFGGANLITIEIAVKEGDIFTHETLGKIRKITDEISFVPGIDRSKVISIGAKKIKETRATSWGIEKISLLWPDVPSTPESLQALRHVCMSDETIFGSLVSVNGKAALIMADVYEKGVNYQQVYGNIRKILDQEVDSRTTIHVSGEPIVVGEVIKAMPKILWIFGISMVLVLGILYLHFMNLRIPLLHISVSGATTIWGLGMMELLHFTLNPMTTIVPFLLMVISISHANQLIIRYAEKSSLRGAGGVAAAEEALGEILIPGISALGTNLAGFAVLAVIPIGTIQELAITASIGMCCAVLRDLTLLPILLCRIPNLRATQNGKHAAAGGVMERALARVSRSIFNKTERVVVLGIMAILFVAGTYYARHLDIGSLHPGSPLFWEKSRYNQDTKKINEDFFGTDAMSVVIQGKPGVLREPEVLKTMEKYQRFISGVPNVGGAISVVDLVKNVNQKIHEDDPVWYTVPATPKEVGSDLYLVYTGGDSGDFDIFGTTELDSANIRVFFKDHTVTTINRALDETKGFIAQNPLKDARYRLAGGIIGVLAAIGEVLQKYHLQATLLSYGIICLVVFLTFRSFMAVALICIPLGMVSMMSFAFMKLVSIELDVNTLPIAALGMGLCVDYGIYLYGKIRSEADGGGTFQEVLDRAMVSCGSAVIITGTTFTLGVVLWLFSDLRFQATMGVLLAFMFVMNMVTSILVLPILIDLVKPKDIFSSIEKSNRVLVAKKDGGEGMEGWQQAAIKVRPDIT